VSAADDIHADGIKSSREDLLFASSLEPKSSAASVFIDKHDPCAFEGAPYNIKCGPTRFANSRLKLINCDGTDASFLGQFFLAPTKKRASRPALRRSDCCC
jgi:hypothetical protein